MNTLVKCALISLPLMACGGGGGGSQTENPHTSDVDYTHLSNSKLEPGPLRQASASELDTLIKNGLRVTLRDSYNYRDLVMSASVVDKSGESTAYSGTNVQVSGVDEADNAKYDGRYIYAIAPTNYTETGATISINIFATDSTSISSEQVGTITEDAGHWGNVSDMYLVGQPEATTGLVTIRRSWDIIAFAESFTKGVKTQLPSTKAGLVADEAKMATSGILPYHFNRGIDITLYDVRNPASPAKSWSLSLDGTLLGSRKIGDTLYVISNFIPQVPNLVYNAQTLQERVDNEKLIAQSPLEKLLPEYQINGGTAQPLGNGSCLIPATTDSRKGFLSLVNITAIDTKSQKLINSTCIDANVAGIYSSPTRLYLGASANETWDSWNSFTVIHQFNLTPSGAQYSATGSVPGYLGWNQPAYRMDEYENNLRLVTTSFDAKNTPNHHLFVLRKQEGRSELETIAELPNKSRPEAIGKPNEDIFAVRFDRQRAFVVTFERKDPLYVLNLSNPKDPQVAGALEVPGVSTYLHPIGDNLIFSVGNEADEKGRLTGIKASLFDIHDINKPQLLGSHLLGSAESWSNALYDPHALAFLQASPHQLRVSLPMNIYESVEQTEFSTIRWVNTGLQLLEVNGINTKPSLDLAGNVIGESASKEQEYPLYVGDDRSFLKDNAVFYVHGGKVINSPWSPKK